ncbi:MAG TPA: transcriptional repressor [Stellaceae bacterium]|jgi:Fur family iron response transcriptional regulator|nr:transcriptional repressor [Stellaceae bacterium]
MTRGTPRRQRRPGRRKKSDRDHSADAELQLLKDELRRAGLLPTRPRLILARLLKTGGLRFVTPERLHAEARSGGDRVSLATCYNTLEILAKRGLVRRIFFERLKQFYHTDPSHHAHIYFEDTGELHGLPSKWLSVAQGLLDDVPADRINLLVWIDRAPPA